jgi:hypothetical protein
VGVGDRGEHVTDALLVVVHEHRRAEDARERRGAVGSAGHHAVAEARELPSRLGDDVVAEAGGQVEQPVRVGHQRAVATRCRARGERDAEAVEVATDEQTRTGERGRLEQIATRQHDASLQSSACMAGMHGVVLSPQRPHPT